MSGTVDVTARSAEVRPDRVIGDLRELAALTGGPDGARRLCWTPEWQKARDWLRAKLAELPCTIEIDQAGNLWATLAGQTPDVVVVGSHIDSVPTGAGRTAASALRPRWRCCAWTRRRRRPRRPPRATGPAGRAPGSART